MNNNSRSVATSGTTDSRSTEKCISCVDAIANVVFRPCNHTVMCTQCAARLTRPCCPICRGNIAHVGLPIETGTMTWGNFQTWREEGDAEALRVTAQIVFLGDAISGKQVVADKLTELFPISRAVDRRLRHGISRYAGNARFGAIDVNIVTHNASRPEQTDEELVPLLETKADVLVVCVQACSGCDRSCVKLQEFLRWTGSHIHAHVVVWLLTAGNRVDDFRRGEREDRQRRRDEDRMLDKVDRIRGGEVVQYFNLVGGKRQVDLCQLAERLEGFARCCLS